MIRVFFTIILVTILGSASGQVILNIEKEMSFPDLRVKITEDSPFPDFRVRMGTDIPFEDISVAVTRSRSIADFIITTSPFANKRILYGRDLNFEDAHICMSENMSFPDITIEIRKIEVADYLIYTDKEFISREEILICLLDVIRREKRKKDR